MGDHSCTELRVFVCVCVCVLHTHTHTHMHVYIGGDIYPDIYLFYPCIRNEKKSDSCVLTETITIREISAEFC
jgi:site-specific DNA-adenine methylase